MSKTTRRTYSAYVSLLAKDCGDDSSDADRPSCRVVTDDNEAAGGTISIGAMGW